MECSFKSNNHVSNTRFRASGSWGCVFYLGGSVVCISPTSKLFTFWQTRKRTAQWFGPVSVQGLRWPNQCPAHCLPHSKLKERWPQCFCMASSPGGKTSSPCYRSFTRRSLMSGFWTYCKVCRGVFGSPTQCRDSGYLQPTYANQQMDQSSDEGKTIREQAKHMQITKYVSESKGRGSDRYHNVYATR